MERYAAHRALPSVCLISVVATIGLPCTVFAQEEPRQHVTRPAATTEQYLHQIEQIEDQGDVNAVALIEPHTSLGLMHFEQGEFELASAEFAKARAIVRSNYGLGTARELELLGREVQSEEANGNLAAAWELEQTLLDNARSHIGDLATYAVYRTLAEKRLDTLAQYRSGDFPPQIVLGCYYGKSMDRDPIVVSETVIPVTAAPKRQCTSGDRHTVIIALLREARTYQVLAIEALLQNDRYSSGEMSELVTAFLRASERLHRYLPQYDDPLLGRIMDRVVGREVTDLAAKQQQAMFLIQLADLNVRRGYGASRPAGFDAVLEQYRRAYEQLKNQGVGQTAIDRVFSPMTPIMLPSFENNLLASHESSGSNRHIDVAFNVTRYGRGKDVEIIGATDNVNRADKRKLTRLIRENTFRPITTDGQFADNTPIVLRYYLPQEKQD